jgi:predicted CXXCH cytochrome family protein
MNKVRTWFAATALMASSAQAITPSASSACLSCHDGTLAANARSTVVAPSVGGARFGLGHSHPVGVEYSIAGQSRANGLIPAALLRGVILIAGRVECESCHEPHEPDSNVSALRVNMRGSALCFACHNK